MSETFYGKVEIKKDVSGMVGTGPLTFSITLDGDTGDITAKGDLFLIDRHGNELIHLGGEEQNLVIKNADGEVVIELGRNGNLYAGGGGKDGDVVLRDKDGNELIHLGGEEQNLVIKNADGEAVIELGRNGNLYAGGGGKDGEIVLRDKDGNDRIHLDADSGDIKLSGADCAEDFSIKESETIEPGMVLVVAQDDLLQPNKKAYDKKVVGVVSGAGDYKPGIVLGKKHSRNKRVPVALTGRVYCMVDAHYASIEVGDLLTTSPTLGHAMKANDSLKAFGAVIGKALHPLKNGTGLIPILVALQ